MYCLHYYAVHLKLKPLQLISYKLNTGYWRVVILNIDAAIISKKYSILICNIMYNVGVVIFKKSPIRGRIKKVKIENLIKFCRIFLLKKKRFKKSILVYILSVLSFYVVTVKRITRVATNAHYRNLWLHSHALWSYFMFGYSLKQVKCASLFSCWVCLGWRIF